jgi:hypothetical protein
MDFEAIPYLHHNPEGVAFGEPGDRAGDDRVVLSSYTYSSDWMRPGDTLTVSLSWGNSQRMTDGRQVALRLVSPAEHVAEQLRDARATYTLAESITPLTSATVHRLPLPENVARGLYLLQVDVWGPGGELSARTPSGAERGPLYLRPVRVTEGAPVSPDAPLLALVGPDIRLHAARVNSGTESPDLTIDLEWSTVRRLASNYKISARLLDPAGDLRFSVDTQPGYGFIPTSLWRPNERVADRYVLQVPGDLSPGDGYRLLFIFYQATSLAEVARVELGPFALPLNTPLTFEPRPRLFELPSLSHTLDVDFTSPPDSVAGDHIQLAGYDLVEKVDALNLTLWWIAQRQPLVDYTAFVHLFDPTTETIVVQHDGMPRQGGYPTSGWLAGEVVSDTVQLSLDDVPSGVYRIAVGLYDLSTRDRLTITAADGASLPDQRLILPDEIKVQEE